LPDIFPIPIAQEMFVLNDMEAVYSKILTDVIERTDGLPQDAPLWDSCLQSEASDGLITLIAKAMVRKEDLFLVYKEGIVRRADAGESAQIRADYKQTGKSGVGVYISFTNYKRTDMVKLYASLEYCVVSGLYKSVNLSKAVQYKIAELRSSVSLTDKAAAEEQATEIAEALSCGRDVMMDSKDMITSHKPDLEAAEKTIDFLDSKRCFYLGLPKAYVNGTQTGGLGDSGNGDSKAIERGLKSYFVSIMKPTLEAIFSVKVNFKPSDMAQIGEALEALKTFELVGDSYLDDETKTKVVNRLFGFDS
jgi:hypothetical protein